MMVKSFDIIKETLEMYTANIDTGSTPAEAMKAVVDFVATHERSVFCSALKKFAPDLAEELIDRWRRANAVKDLINSLDWAD